MRVIGGFFVVGNEEKSVHLKFEGEPEQGCFVSDVDGRFGDKGVRVEDSGPLAEEGKGDG